MSNDTPQLKRGDQYIVFFVGGPNDGRTDTRISTDGSWDEELTVIATVDGKETLINYDFESVRVMGDQVQVLYRYDEAESEELESLDDRGEH